MIRIVSAAVLLAAVPAAAREAAAPATSLSIQQQAALRCSAAFALGAVEQAEGRNKAWPVLAKRGKEFFVRSSAGIMDEAGWTREQIVAELTAQARSLKRPGELEAAMPPCLLLLDASGL